MEAAEAKPAQVQSLFGGGNKPSVAACETSQDSTQPKGGAAIKPIPSKDVTTGCKANYADSEADEYVNPYLHEYLWFCFAVTNRIRARSTTSESPPMIPTIFETFEKEYDLTILVGISPTAEFKVCSRSVAKASKYFDTLLNGEFSEAKPENGNWVIKLPETDYASFRIILSQIHGGRSIIPDKVGEELYNLIKEIDYFGTYHLFKFYWRDWILEVVNELRKKDASSIAHSRLFWAAWILGCKSQISLALQKVFRGVKRNKDGRCYIKDETLVEFYPEIRFNLNEVIGQRHQYFIEKMAREYENRFKEILDPTRPENKFLCKSRETYSDESKSICDKALLGSFFQEIWKRKGSGLGYFKEYNLRHLSVSQCADRLLLFKLKGVEASWRDHKSCNPTDVLQASVRKIKASADAYNILTDEHTAYLDNQLKIWGWSYEPGWLNG